MLVIPLLLDALLWLAPRISIEPLLLQLADLYRSMGSDLSESSGDLAALTSQMTDLLTTAGTSSNLLQFLVNGALFHVPSLMVNAPMLKDAQHSIQIESAGAAGILGLGFSITGVLIGVLYMNLLAQALPLGEGHKMLSPVELGLQVLRHWLRTLLFVIGFILAMLIVYIPISILATLLMVLSPALGGAAMLLLSGLSLVVLFYLYFVTVGLVLDDLSISQAVVRSVTLTRHNFWTTVGFILVTMIISLGIGLLISQLAVSGPIGSVIAALLNAFIGTGMVLALLVFYRTRLLATIGEPTTPGSL
ncbi:MAG: hypothetical protein R2873_01010 [Caldilineaceae bacterium]